MTHEHFTLVALLLRGHQEYTSDYLVKLRSMVARHTTKSFDVLVLTDGTFDIPAGMKSIVIEPSPGRAWWSKLQLFKPGMPFTGRMLYLDLDILVIGGLDDIIDYPADFAIAPCSAVGWLGRGAKKVCKGYNSSAIVFDAGCRPQLFTEFTRNMTQVLWGDQDAIKQISPDEKMFPPEWTVRLSRGKPGTWHEDTRLVLCIHEKPHIAIKTHDWFAEYWR